jgi:hypothetical protein
MLLNVCVKGRYLDRFKMILAGVQFAEKTNKHIVLWWPREKGKMEYELQELVIPSSIPRVIRIVNDEMLRDYDVFDEWYAKRKETPTLSKSLVRQPRMRPEIEIAADKIFRTNSCLTSWPAIVLDKGEQSYGYQGYIPKITNGPFWLSTENETIEEEFKSYYGGSCVTGDRTYYNRESKEGQMYEIVEWTFLHKFNTILGNSLMAKSIAKRSGANFIPIQ